MKKFLFLPATLILCLVFSSCNFYNFSGIEILEDDNFQIDYAFFNQQKSGFLTLAKGDVLQVLISHSKGSVDVKVATEEKNVIYEGKNLTNMKFTLNIEEDGIYQIDVIAHKACGSVKFTKKR